MTGCTFSFQEVERFPNYQMLARAFAGGRLSIEEQPRVDVAVHEGKRYLYHGPVPAAIRAPLAALGIRIPTGLMVALLCAAFCLVFWLVCEAAAPADRPDDRMIWAFTALCAGNGLMLFMSVLPSIHHEAILWAALWLMLAVLGVLRTWRRGPTIGRGVWIGSTAGLAVGCRVSYLLPGLIVVGVFCWTAYRKRRPTAVVAAAAPLLVTGLLLAGYNEARFSSPTEFGVNHLASTYQDYIRDGHFWRLDHVPYNLWDNLCRLPDLGSRFPFLETGITLQEVSQRSATAAAPYRLIHVNELTTSLLILVPALWLAAGLLRCRGDASDARPAWLFGAVAAVQMGLLSLTFASTARYQFDFAPYLMLLAFLGAIRIQTDSRAATRLVYALIAVSLVVGLYLPFNAVEQYEPFIGYHSPWLDILR